MNAAIPRQRSARRRLGLIASLMLSLTLLLGAATLPALAQPAPSTTTTTTSIVPFPGATAPAAAPGGAATPVIPADGAVVASKERGELNVIEGGRARALVGGLASPNGMAVLPDGSVIVADSGNNRIVGYGGRFGDALKPIVSVEFPEGVTVGPDGSVYVTLLLKGEVGKVDVDAGTYTTLASEIKGPGGVAVRDGILYVTEGAPGGQDIISIAPDGTKALVANGFEQPIGIVNGPDRSFFVADYKANKVIRVDQAGKLTDFARLDAPVMVSTIPFQVTGATFAVLATGEDGLVRFDQTGRRTATVAIPGATGVGTLATLDPAVAATSTTTTTTVPVTVAPTTAVRPRGPTTTALRPATTRLRSTTTLADPDLQSASSNSGILTFSLGAIALAVLAGLAFFFLRKPKNMEKAGFEERPLDADTVADAFGPCAAEEVELAESEGARDAVIVQRESSEKRKDEAMERAVEVRARLVEATAAREAVEQERRHAQQNGVTPPTGSTEIQPDELRLATDAGRRALAAFTAGELDAHQLEERWSELGEQRAIDVVRAVGERRARLDPSQPWPDEVRAQEHEARVQAELEEAERDAAYADAEIERLNEREGEAMDRIIAARASLEACHERHRVHREAKATAAAEAAAAEAAARPAPPTAPDAESLPTREADAAEAPDSSADQSADAPTGTADEQHSGTRAGAAGPETLVAEPAPAGNAGEPASPAEMVAQAKAARALSRAPRPPKNALQAEDEVDHGETDTAPDTTAPDTTAPDTTAPDTTSDPSPPEEEAAPVADGSARLPFPPAVPAAPVPPSAPAPPAVPVDVDATEALFANAPNPGADGYPTPRRRPDPSGEPDLGSPGRITRGDPEPPDDLFRP